MYGFTHKPYIFLAFLTPRVSALDIVIQKLIVENEHFISFKKDSEIKFPWVIGPFIIKNKATLPVVESMLQKMDFKKYFVVKYDPQHVILLRRQMNKKTYFEHHVVEGLAEKVNWLDYPSPLENVEVSQENPLSMVKETKVVTPIASSS